MPNHKRPLKKNKKDQSPPRKSQPGARRARAPIKRPRAPDHITEEYAEYLERYEFMGAHRPRLSPAEFDRLDTELLDLLATQGEQGALSDEQLVRLQELEFLLLDEQ